MVVHRVFHQSSKNVWCLLLTQDFQLTNYVDECGARGRSSLLLVLDVLLAIPFASGLLRESSTAC